MKKTIILVLVTAVAVASQAQIISWNENNVSSIPALGVAGVMAATNWNNSTGGMSLLDNSGAASGASFTIGGSWGAWQTSGTSPGQDANLTYNRNLLNGYANTSSGIGPEIFSITGIPYSLYDVYVYVSSDTAGRTGTIANSNLGLTYDLTTIGPAAISGANAVLTQSTDTTGANPAANYVMFSGVTGSASTLTLNIANGGGISGFQIVAIPEPGTLALATLGGFAMLGWKRRAARL